MPIRWIEMIKVSTLGNNSKLSKESVMKIIAAADKGKQMHEIRVFRNPPVDNNLLIQIYWNSENVESQGSSTGLCLAHILKELGLTSHSVWLEKQYFYRRAL